MMVSRILVSVSVPKVPVSLTSLQMLPIGGEGVVYVLFTDNKARRLFDISKQLTVT